jgi:hypothetical protein
MNRTFIAAFVLLVGASMHAVAVESDHVRWKPNRNVKDAVFKEILQFEEDMRVALGSEVLTHTPFVVEKNHPKAAALEAITIDDILDGMFKQMRKWADHDNEEYLPVFDAYRRSRVAAGSDILSAPVMLTAPRFGQLSGNITVKVEWEQVDGRFKNNWDHNDVDEVYEVELNATLTLGIALSLRNDRKVTVINHLVAKPLVTGWRTSLVGSEGEVQELVPPKRAENSPGT